jgi:hypothetical protein
VKDGGEHFAPQPRLGRDADYDLATVLATFGPPIRGVGVIECEHLGNGRLDALIVGGRLGGRGARGRRRRRRVDAGLRISRR